MVGAFWPPYKQWSAPLPEALRVIADHPIGWRCIHAGFLFGTVVSTLGLSVLAYGLRGQSGGALALAVAVAFGIASVLWFTNMAFRLSVTTWAADELVATGTIPATYTPWKSFAALLFAFFSSLGYLSVAGCGWTILLAGIGPRWLGWLLVGWGLSAGFVFGANVPFIMYVAFVLLGAFLVRGS